MHVVFTAALCAFWNGPRCALAGLPESRAAVFLRGGGSAHDCRMTHAAPATWTCAGISCSLSYKRVLTGCAACIGNDEGDETTGVHVSRVNASPAFIPLEHIVMIVFPS